MLSLKQYLSEGLSRDASKKIIRDFIAFCKSELELDTLPKIVLHANHEEGVRNSSFGGYGGHVVYLTITNRHIMDVCRTLAHELVHYSQDLKDELTPESGETGSPHENEANAQAAVIMRKWGKLHPDYFGLAALE
jgi:hypothetical protein